MACRVPSDRGSEGWHEHSKQPLGVAAYIPNRRGLHSGGLADPHSLSRSLPVGSHSGSWPLLVIVERGLFVQMMYTPSGGRALVQATVCHACTTSAQTAQLSRLPRRRCERSRGRTMRCLCACAWLCGLGFGVGRCRRTLGWSRCLSPT